jgi:hypothetical protein
MIKKNFPTTIVEEMLRDEIVDGSFNSELSQITIVVTMERESSFFKVFILISQVFISHAAAE